MQAFQILRERLLKNEKLFKWFLLAFIIFTVSIIIDKLFFHQIQEKAATIMLPTSISSSSLLFLGFLNYRTKVGTHDMLVDLYEKAPPPPKITVVKLIIENSNFKPFKLKL